MSHVRAQIREYVRDKVTSIQGLEQAVTIDSEEIPDELVMPWCHILLGDEDIAVRGLGDPTKGRKLERSLQLTTDLYFRDKKEPLLLAEDYAAAIEAKLAANPRMGGIISDLVLRAYTIARNDEGSQPIVQLRMQWFATYFTHERDATVPA